MFGQPVSSETDEIGAEQNEMLLQAHGGQGTNFDVMSLEDLSCFFVARFDGLAGVVVVKPGWQVFGDLGRAKMHQARKRLFGLDRVARGLPETFIAQVKRVGEVWQG